MILHNFLFLVVGFAHSLFILDPISLSVAAHTYDVLGKKISEYNFAKVRFVHIENIGI